jgi:calcineurin-like phosphoesterase family protein
MSLFFTADTHFGHRNINGYTHRPFKTTEEMDEVLINNWNSVVGPEDKVIFAGDFCFKNFKKYRERLNGEIIFVFGNHDYEEIKQPHVIGLVVEIKGQKIYVTHNPDDFDKGFRINLVGHVHNLWTFRKMGDCVLVNVGVDVWGFSPVSFDIVLKALGNWRVGK